MCCGRNLAAAREARTAAKITDLSLGPKGENLRDVFKPLLSIFLWQIERSGVSDVSKVLMQVFCENFRVLFFKPLAPFVYEFELWGIGAFEARHWNGATEGGLLGDPEASQTLRPHRHVLYIQSTGTFAVSSPCAHFFAHPVTAAIVTSMGAVSTRSR